MYWQIFTYVHAASFCKERHFCEIKKLALCFDLKKKEHSDKNNHFFWKQIKN